MRKILNNNPLISIITASLNAEKHIEQTIRSVLEQTYLNIEYIIKDGESTDGTVDIIRKFEDRLTCWESSPDSGISHSLNIALSKTKGQWIIMLHADDFFLNHSVVEQMVPFLNLYHEAEVVFGKTIYMTREILSQPIPFRKPLGRPWSWQSFRWHNTIPHPSAFINRRYFERVGYFNESLRLTMDYELFLRGGKTLKANFVPLAVSGMREGGVSRRQIISTLIEGKRVRLENRVLTSWLAWLNLFRQMGRYYISLLRKPLNQ